MRTIVQQICRVRTSLLLALLALAAPLSAGSAAAADKGLEPGKPSDVDMEAGPLAEIAQRMQAFVEQQKLAGVVTLVARQGRIVHLEAIGQADIDNKLPMRKDTLFGIASMTKPITGAAVMVLVDEGKLSLDDPVSKYIPAFKDAALASGPPQREITLRDVVTHTSGLGGDQQNMGTLKETGEKLAQRKLGFEPGSKWQYSPGLSVAGSVVEIVSGKPFDVFLRERFFEPLKMVDTSFHPTPEQQKRLAKIYQPSKDKKSLERTTSWITDLSEGRTPNPSGGLFSTATDVARFYQMVLNGGELDGRRILSEKAVKEMTSIQTGDIKVGFTDGNGWGLGCCVVRKPQGPTEMLSPGTFGHGGAFGTQSWADPKREMIFVLMIQRAGLANGDASEFRVTLQDLAVKASAVGALRKALRERATVVEAMYALGRIGPTAKDAAWDVVTHRHITKSSGLAADSAISGIGAAALPIYLEKLQQGDDGAQVAAAHAIGVLGPKAKAAVPQLTTALSDKNAALRETAAHSLGRIGKDAEEAVPALIKALKDKESRVRIPVAHALGNFPKNSEHIVPELIAAMKDPDRRVRGTAIQSLGRHGKAAKAVVPDLIVLLADEQVASEAASALGSIGPEAKESVPALTRLLESKETELSLVAARALGGIGAAAEPALPQLERMLLGAEQRGRYHAAIAMAGIGENSLPSLLKAVGHADPKISASGRTGIRRLGKPAAKAIPELKRLRDAAKEDETRRELDTLIEEVTTAGGQPKN